MIEIGKNSKFVGKTPSVLLVNPKHAHNVGAVLRAASCYGIKQLWFTGNRVKLDSKQRLPREERMKGYQDVDLIQFDYPFDVFKNVTPVAIEILPNSIPLPYFEHPKNPLSNNV